MGIHILCDMMRPTGTAEGILTQGNSAMPGNVLTPKATGMLSRSTFLRMGTIKII